MRFRNEAIEDFKKFFLVVNQRILEFQGCREVCLWQDLENPNALFTLSTWDSPADLEEYRQSEFFRQTWEKAKSMFSDKAQAWTLIGFED